MGKSEIAEEDWIFLKPTRRKKGWECCSRQRGWSRRRAQFLASPPFAPSSHFLHKRATKQPFGLRNSSTFRPAFTHLLRLHCVRNTWKATSIAETRGNQQCSAGIRSVVKAAAVQWWCRALTQFMLHGFQARFEWKWKQCQCTVGEAGSGSSATACARLDWRIDYQIPPRFLLLTSRPDISVDIFRYQIYQIYSDISVDIFRYLQIYSDISDILRLIRCLPCLACATQDTQHSR